MLVSWPRRVLGTMLIERAAHRDELNAHRPHGLPRRTASCAASIFDS